MLTLGGKSVVALPGGVTAVVGLPAGLSVSDSGGLQVAGLDWFGARAYDLLTRGFLSVDPLLRWSGGGCR